MAPSADPPHVAALDGLRAVAASLVVLTHAAFLTGFVFSGGLIGRLMGRGDIGVAIFFGLSGYLLYAHLVEDDSRGRLNIGRYFVRRVLRVMPAYWVVLLAVWVVFRPTLHELVTTALAVQIYTRTVSIDAFSQSWSVATELSFYAVLPFVVVALRGLRRRRPRTVVALLATGVSVGIVAAGWIGSGVIGESVLVERWLPSRASNFLLGMLLAELLRQPDHPLAVRVRQVAAAPGSLLALAAGAYLLATTPVAGVLTLGVVEGAQLGLKMALATLVTFGLLVPLLFGPDNPYRRALARPGVSWAGRVSYGIFLWHLPVFTLLYAVAGLRAFSGGLVPMLSLGVPITLALAAATYYWVERPLQRLTRRAPRPVQTAQQVGS